jgi:hypothetical protein
MIGPVEVIALLFMTAFGVLIIAALLFLVIWLRGRRRPRYMSKPARTSLRVWPPKDGGGRAA